MDASSISVSAGAIALTLVHFVWQGVLIGAAVATLMWIVRPRTAHARYAIYCATLAVLAVCPLATLVFVAERDVEIGSARTAPISVTESLGSTVVPSSPYAAQRVRAAESSLSDAADGAARWLESQRTTILVMWSVGAGCCLLRLTTGSVYLWRIARRGRPLPAELQHAVRRLGAQMNFRRLPAVRVVDEISQAMAVGIVRPMVLLPAAWVSGLSGEMLEAVIAHELAHLRRWDLLVNLLQRVVEATLFFHPVVWWCSRRIRLEREMCCDEAAVAALGNRVTYANALSHLAEHATLTCEPAWAMGIGDSKMVLFERIRNVLGMGSVSHGRWYGASCAVLGAAVASLVWGAVLLGLTTDNRTELATKPGEDRKEVPRELGVPIIDPANKEFTRAFSDRIARHPELLGITTEPQTQRFMLGEGVNSNAVMTGTIENAPSEHRKVLLPSYTIEPPDILTISVAKVEGKPGIDSKQDLPPITGEHLVSPDGTVNLGRYGQVLVAGMTLEEAKKKIEEHLSDKLDNPEATVAVHSYNSKVYYVIHQGGEEGDMVTRLPVTGNETVLDALSQVNGLDGMQDKQIWIARPLPGGAAADAILQVNWQEITAGAATASNYQVLPGDRIFVQETPLIERAAQGALRLWEQAKAVERAEQGHEHFVGEER